MPHNITFLVRRRCQMSNNCACDDRSSHRTRRLRAFELMLIGAALCAGAHGCSGHSCKEIGCPPPGVDVVFSRALDSTRTYAVSVVADGIASTCTVTSHSTKGCAGAAIWTSSQPAMTLTGQRLQPGGFAGLRVFGDPSSVTLTLSDNANILGTGKFDSIGYTGVAINGPGCGACSSASVSMNVP